MNADELLRHYEHVADAPEAVARLRRFVLDLAVRGKLVPQDPADEPAAELLKRIARERAKPVDARPGHKQAWPADLVVALPHGWATAKFEEVLLDLQTGPFGSSLHQSDYVVGGTPVINPASIQGERIVPIDKMAVGPATLERLAAFKLRAGDVVLGRRGEMGRCAVVTDYEQGWLCGTGSLILRLSGQMCARFVVLLVGSPSVRNYLGGKAVGATMQNLNQSILLNLAIGLPPAAEQHRIVAKVDELMALCDRLEAARAQRETARDRLARSCLARLDTPDPETFREDARLALDALPALTARPDQIKPLRQTILNLAVRGHLTCRDVQGKANVQSVTAVHGQFDVPDNWAWRFAIDLCERIESGSTPPSAEMFEGAGDVPFIKVYNLTKTGALDFSVKSTFVSRETHMRRLSRSRILPGDVLMNIVGPPLGKVSIVPATYPEWNTNQAVVLFRPSPELLARYLAICLLSESVLSQLTDLAQQTVGQVNISVGKSRRLPIPLPPLAEQHRIVAKVDELMALCDQLETQLNTTETDSRRLLEAVLHETPSPALEEAA